MHLIAPVGECFAVLIEHGQHELAVGISLFGCGEQQLLRALFVLRQTELARAEHTGEKERGLRLTCFGRLLQESCAFVFALLFE